MQQPVTLFSYAASQDTHPLTEWENHLLPLQQAGNITLWSEQHLAAGTNRNEQISKHLEEAKIIGRPITHWPDRDEAFHDCIDGIKLLLAKPVNITSVNSPIQGVPTDQQAILKKLAKEPQKRFANTLDSAESVSIADDEAAIVKAEAMPISVLLQRPSPLP